MTGRDIFPESSGCPPKAVAAAPVGVLAEIQPKGSADDYRAHPADSRAVVIERQRAADRAVRLLVHVTPPERAAQLRRIARSVDCQELRLLAALRLGWVTSQEAHRNMDVTDAHARLHGLRAAGFDIADEWVIVRDELGRESRRKRYAING